MTRLPSPLTVPSVLPDPETIWTLTAANTTVGLPPTPDETKVGASTDVVPAPQEGVEPVPPETTACPAVAGMHSQPGVVAASACEANTAISAATTVATNAMRTISRTPLSCAAPAARQPAARIL